MGPFQVQARLLISSAFTLVSAVIWQVVWGWLVSDDLAHRSGTCVPTCQLEQWKHLGYLILFTR